MKPDDLCRRSGSELANLIARHEVSPVEVADAYLTKIHDVNPAVNAFISVDSDLVGSAARAAEVEIARGHLRSPLHGLCVAVKDNIETEQFTTTAGSKLLSEWRPTSDAPVIRRLKEAGAIILGKTNMHEFAYGGTCTNRYFGAVRNPWDIDHVPGGSSGGSAVAVALGMCSFALGTDTAGSVRLPAAMCGVIGLKPTLGRVPIDGVIPLAWSLDHVGPITSCVDDAAMVLKVIGSRSSHSVKGEFTDDPRGPSNRLDGVSLGIPKHYFYEPLWPDVEKATTNALEVLGNLGAKLVEVDWRSAQYSNSITWTIILAEAATYHRRWLSTDDEAYEWATRANLEQGAFMPATAYIQAQRARSILYHDVTHILSQVDALVTPALPITAPRIAQETVELGGKTRKVNPVFIRLANPFNVTGLPAISVPCGYGQHGLPIGLQIASGRFDDAVVLRIARAYTEATDWDTERWSLHLRESRPT